MWAKSNFSPLLAVGMAVADDFLTNSTQVGERHEAIRSHREAARYQAREGMDLEIHLRADRRLLRGFDCRRNPRPDETHQTAGCECRRVVRVVEVRNRNA